MSAPLLEVEDLTIRYDIGDEMLTAVSDASFSIEEGEYFGLVGESGCGKSTLAKAIVGGLDNNGVISSGTVSYKGSEIQDFSDEEYNESVRWKEISWIPQGSMTSLDPLKRLGQQAYDIANTHTDLTREEALDRFREQLEVVGLPESRISDYPHQLSGGMQQRAIIALALFLDSSLIIADEPTTALDVIMQDQIFKYLNRIKEEQDTAVILITHDISLVFESCDTMAVMHGGQVAETGTVTELYDSPQHPYSILLQRSFPTIEDLDRDLEVIEGDPPETIGEVNHCTFVDRCPWGKPECRSGAPELEHTGDTHQVSCFRKEHIQQQLSNRQESVMDTNFPIDPDD